MIFKYIIMIENDNITSEHYFGCVLKIFIDNIGSDNDSLLTGDKPLLDSVFTQIYDAICHC